MLAAFTNCSKPCFSSKVTLQLEKPAIRSLRQTMAKCLCDKDINELLPKSAVDSLENIKVSIDYHVDIKENASCDGIYYYRLFSNQWKTPLIRGKEGKLSRYNYFVILKGQLIVFNTVDEARNSKLFGRYEGDLVAKFGSQKVKQVKENLIRGYIMI